MDDYIQDSILDYKESVNKNGTTIHHHKDVSLSKHFIIKDIIETNGSYVKLNDYIFPEYLDSNLNHALDGPYISSKYIIFYEEIKKIAIVFTCSSIKSNTGHISDFSLRELNSYILDNFYRVDFDDLIASKVTHTLDYKKDILSHNTMSLKIGNYNKNPTILRLIKENIYSGSNIEIHPFYKWEIIQKETSKHNLNEKDLL
jgi:hypothetical protein